MQPTSSGNIQILRIPLATLPHIPNCIHLLPGLLVGTQENGDSLNKLNMELLVDQFLQKREKPAQLGEMLEEWDDEIAEIMERTWKKVGVDVGTLGSKRTVKEHKCKFCQKVFFKAQALGGHISKLHSHSKKQLSAPLTQLSEQPYSNKQIQPKEEDEDTTPKKKQHNQTNRIKRSLRSKKYILKRQKLNVIFQEQEEKCSLPIE